MTTAFDDSHETGQPYGHMPPDIHHPRRTDEMYVLKVGGTELDNPEFIARLVEQVRVMNPRPIIVHGGGKAIRELQERFDITPQYIDGLRVTDDLTMNLVVMALCGAANVSIVSALIKAGVDAQGFNGADRGLLWALRLVSPHGDLMRVGRVVNVNAEILRAALAEDIVPVIAPVALAQDAHGLYNVNADQAAGAVAVALGASAVTFLTNVGGVLHDGAVLPSLTEAEAEALLDSGVAREGMIVKLRAALDALSSGVGAVVITNLDGLRAGTGTTITLD